MFIPADMQFRLPVGTLVDVPIERCSVGGMALAAGSQMPETFRPYVYRGTGVDQMPELDPTYEAPTPKPQPKPKPKPRKRRKRRPVGRPWQPRQPRQRPVLDIADVSTWGNWTPPPEPEPVPVAPAPPPKPLRPAKGWQPLSGDDLDAALNEIGEAR